MTDPTETWYVYSDGAQPSAAEKGVARIAPGGWGVVVLLPPRGEDVIEAWGGEALTTVPRMEMTGALEGLKFTPEGADVVVTSDSSYLINGMTVWLPSWLRRNWRSSTGAPVKNRDLWEALLAAQTGRTVRWRHVRGHTGDLYNERADRLAALGVPRAE